ncbi:sulfotransferase domain-containing protein [uncultured Draconibacterium sp.]|uniref:sulfotransferase domain-containing protein n=1 Tax=uncultured Draconibacterium sp. TaxID=1573823 RepID=UPI0029C7A849|nr:sulfotransferase domain-containing protein [uncultured Draconibacterium sp.]
MSIKVDFILLGAAKAGTTTMADILRSHPDISFCKEKEPDFFSKTNDWKANLNEYHNLFSEGEGKIYGEASHSYTVLPRWNLNIWEDIYAYNPKMKFIYIVRNPIDRFISEYMQDFQRGRLNYTIDEALHKSKSINRSRYYTQILPYIERFGLKRILFIDFEDFIKKREVVLEDVASFLEITANKFDINNNEHSNYSVNSLKMNVKYDWILRRFSGLIRLLPGNFVLSIKRLFVSKKRVFNEKPKLTRLQQETIIRLTKQDTLELGKLIKKDLSGWLKVK